MKFLLPTLVALSLAPPDVGMNRFFSLAKWCNSLRDVRWDDNQSQWRYIDAMPSELCVNSTIAILSSTLMYYYFGYPLTFVDHDTGMFNCDINALACLKCLCLNKSLGGRVITADVVDDGCSSPLCVSNYCTDSEAIWIMNYFVSCTNMIPLGGQRSAPPSKSIMQGSQISQDH